MKKEKILSKLSLLLFFIACTWCVLSWAEEKEQVMIDPGMERLKVGDAQFLVPKGTKVRMQADVAVIEDIGEYSGRKFEELQDRITELETTLKEMKEELRQLIVKVQAFTPQKAVTNKTPQEK